MAARTERVYDRVAALPVPTLAERFERHRTSGPFFSFFAVWVVASQYLLWCFLELVQPKSGIQLAPELDLSMEGGADDPFTDDALEVPLSAEAQDADALKRARSTGAGSVW